LMGPGGKVIGTLSFGARNRDTFSNDDLLVMKAIADQVAVAMNRMNDEQSLRSAHTELERRAYELEAVNRELEAFSYTVSHDLKAPLRSIEGFAEALSEDYAGKMDATGKDYLGRISAAALRMNQFIDAMLGMARLTRTELHEQTVDLSGLARIIAHDLQKQEPGRAVEFVIAEGVKTEGDHAMLRAVIENLLQNAWKFTSRHAEAKIEFGVMNSAAGDKSKFDKPEPAPSTSGPRTEPDSEIFNQRNSKPVYYVSDNGVGFDMRFANKLFQPFKRLHTDSDFPGLGIGLATANRIILRHNGRLWAESEPGRGATFYFTLG
ncbi:MAG TPA: ATP-binding protein, partial [Nitrospirota bacterium]|nr:ATP-binding protein [Nitrospirota bacterium]